MSADCYCYYDTPEFYQAGTRTARKQHKCEECRGIIAPKEKYEYVICVLYGCFNHFKTCSRCLSIRTWVTNNVPCVCCGHGEMFEGLIAGVDEAQYRAPEETKGLRFAYLRKIVLLKRHNQKVKEQWLKK